MANLKLTKSVCVCVCEEKEKESGLQWEVNIRGDQKEMLWAVICTVSDRTSNPLAGLSLQPRSIQLPANEPGKYIVFTFKVAVVGLSFSLRLIGESSALIHK